MAGDVAAAIDSRRGTTSEGRPAAGRTSIVSRSSGIATYPVR